LRVRRPARALPRADRIQINSGNPAIYPANNFFPASIGAVGFVPF
jgi:hypothetical protein